MLAYKALKDKKKKGINKTIMSYTSDEINNTEFLCPETHNRNVILGMFTKSGVCLDIMFPPASKLYHGGKTQVKYIQITANKETSKQKREFRKMHFQIIM